MKFSGIALILAAVLLPLIWFYPLASAGQPVAVFSQYIGACALIVMAFSQLLATRLIGLEAIFGAMDRIYVLHKWLGIAAVVLILVHDTVDADMQGLGRETWLNELAETLGELSLYGFLILVVISIATFVPYPLWRLTHKFIGGLYVAAVLHFAMILKPIALTDPLSLYVLTLSGIGIASYFFCLLPETWRRLPHRYRVNTVERVGSAVIITLTPVSGATHHRAGQFVFVRFDLPGGAETHPFTLSDGPREDGQFRLTIKALGGGTKRIGAQIQPGMVAQVSRPFGQFTTTAGTPEIWIAAGVGITPFVARATALSPGRPVHLFYCYRGSDEAVHQEQLEAVARNNPDFQLTLVDSRSAPRLTATGIAAQTEINPKAAAIFFCGPTAMRAALLAEFMSLGVSRRRFHYEVFEIRNGIGLRKIFFWLTARLQRQPARDLS